MNVIDILEQAKALAPSHWGPAESLLFGHSRKTCALGLVGLARWGEWWTPSYTGLREDPDAREAVDTLAAISPSHVEKYPEDDEGEVEQRKVYVHNDDNLHSLADVQAFFDQAIESVKGK